MRAKCCGNGRNGRSSGRRRRRPFCMSKSMSGKKERRWGDLFFLTFFEGLTDWLSYWEWAIARWDPTQLFTTLEPQRPSFGDCERHIIRILRTLFGQIARSVSPYYLLATCVFESTVPFSRGGEGGVRYNLGSALVVYILRATSVMTLLLPPVSRS